MGLELLAGPFTAAPAISRSAVLGVTDPTDSLSGFGGHPILIEGRGILVGGSNGRYLMQHDGSFARLGLSRFGQNSTTVLAQVGSERTYAEYLMYSAGRVHVLHPVTLMGWQDIAATPPGQPSRAVLLPDGSWLSFSARTVMRYSGSGGWVHQADLPISFPFGPLLSWAELPDEVWLANESGEALRYNWRTRAVSAVVRTHVGCMGLWYWRKHGFLISLHWESGTARTRVWATTPRPSQLVQTIAPAPTAGRVSRVSTRLLGSDGEPCAGEVVTWSIAGGYQIVPLSPVTDADGYARADLIVPMGTTGGSAVTASVVV